MRVFRKPKTMEAIQWTGENFAEIEEFTYGKAECHDRVLEITTAEGSVRITKPGVWLLKQGGRIVPCDDSTFRREYETKLPGPSCPDCMEPMFRLTPDYEEATVELKNAGMKVVAECQGGIMICERCKESWFRVEAGAIDRKTPERYLAPALQVRVIPGLDEISERTIQVIRRQLEGALRAYTYLGGTTSSGSVTFHFMRK